MASRNSNNANELQKVVSDSVQAAIDAASGNLGGKSFESIDKALETAANDPGFFNPTLSQYRKGMIINTDESIAKIRKVPVGTGGNEAWCITGAVGTRKADGSIEYTGAFNMYPSTLRKQIQVTDENGDQVLDEQKQPVIVDGAGNPVWDGARACNNPEELLKYAMNKQFECYDIKRDFGPSVFVKLADGSRKATSHKLTSVPLFNVLLSIMTGDEKELLTFWGKLKSNKTIVTSEGTLHHVLHEDSVPHDVYGFFLVEKRRKNYLVIKYLSETIMNKLVPSSR